MYLNGFSSRNRRQILRYPDALRIKEKENIFCLLSPVTNWVALDLAIFQHRASSNSIQPVGVVVVVAAGSVQQKNRSWLLLSDFQTATGIPNISQQLDQTSLIQSSVQLVTFTSGLSRDDKCYKRLTREHEHFNRRLLYHLLARICTYLDFIFWKITVGSEYKKGCSKKRDSNEAIWRH